MLIYCNNPTEAKCLSEANGCAKVYKYQADASKAAKKCNKLHGAGFAKVVGLKQYSKDCEEIDDGDEIDPDMICKYCGQDSCDCDMI